MMIKQFHDVSRRGFLHLGGAVVALMSPLRRLLSAPREPGSQLAAPKGSAVHKPTPRLILAGAPTMSGHIIKSVFDAGDVGMKVDVALSTSAAMTRRTLLGVQTINADRITTHSATGLRAATRYYGRLVVPSTGAYIGEQFSFTTAPPTTGSWTRRIAVVSCQGNSHDHPQAWQDIIDWGADAIWHLGDWGYWGQAIADTDPYSKDISKYIGAGQSNPIMRAAIQSASLDVIEISDHELHINGDHWSDTSGDDTFGCLHSVRELLAFQALMPQSTYWDTRTPRKYRGSHFDLGAKVRVLHPDMRSPERNMASDRDTPAKQLWGADQEAKLFAALDSTRLNMIVCETSWWWGTGYGGAYDKPASYPDAQQRLIDKVNGTGRYAGGPVYKVVWVGGDRHYVGYLSAAANTHGGWPCHISSGMSKNGLPLHVGETPTWQWGASVNLVQSVALAGAVSTFTLTYAGQTTSAIAADASAATVQTALEALSNIAPGDVVVNAANLSQWEVRFGGTLNQNPRSTGTLTGVATGGSLTVTKEDSPVVCYLQMTLSYDSGTGVVSISTQGRAVLDISGPDTEWVIGNIPGGVAINAWTP